MNGTLATVLGQINWAVWAQVIMGVVLFIILNKFGGLSASSIIKTLIGELKDIVVLKPTVGALNAACVIVIAVVILILASAPALEDLIRGALSASNNRLPDQHDNVPMYVCLGCLVLTTIGSVFAARS